MPLTHKVFANAGKYALLANINWTAGTIKGILCSSSLTPGQYTQAFVDDAAGSNDIVDKELSGGGYARQTLSTRATLVVSGDTATKFQQTGNSGQVSWTSLTTSDVRYVILADCTTADDTTSPLISYIDLGATYNISAGTLTITWQSDGATGTVVWKMTFS